MRKFSKPDIDYDKPRTVKEARAMNKFQAQEYRKIMLKTFDKMKISGKRRKVFEALLGKRPHKGNPRASNNEALMELRKNLIELVHGYQKQNPDHRLFFVTMMSDEYRVDKTKPWLFLKKLKAKSYKLIDKELCKKHGVLGGVGAIEPVFIPNPPDDREPVYAFHTHVLLWADKDVDLKAMEESLAEATNWHCSPPLTALQIKEITPKIGKPAWWAFYMLKPPIDALNMVEGKDGKLTTRKTTKGYRPDARLRLFEGLSLFDLNELVFSVRDGSYVLRPALKAMKAKWKLAHPDLSPVDISEAVRMFKRLWKTSRANHKHAWRVVN